MLKAIKREMKGGLPMLWLALGISWGQALVLVDPPDKLAVAGQGPWISAQLSPRKLA